MKGNIDYVWIPVGLIIVILFFAWKPLMGLFGGLRDSATNQEGYERGREAFYDTTLWTGSEGYKSCAMCHAEDFVPEPGRKIDMQVYEEGKVWPLKNIARRYSGGVLDTGDRLYNQIMVCLTQGDRMAMGRVSRKAKYMDDLMLYVRRQ